MSSDTIKGKVAYQCDLPGCHEGIETGESRYQSAWQEAAAEGWQARNIGGDFKHFCCDAHAEMNFRGQRLT